MKVQGIAKFVPGTSDKVFVSGKNTGIFSLKTKEIFYKLKCHNEVNTFSFHSSGELLVAGSLEGSWSLHDVKAKKLLVIQQENSPVTVTEIHPDGLVLAVGL